MIFLSDEMLNKLNSRRLLSYYKSIRRIVALEKCRKNCKRGCCEVHPHYEEMVEYKKKLKSLLDKRENVSP